MTNAPLDDLDSDYGSELDFTDEALLAQLDETPASSIFIKQQATLPNGEVESSVALPGPSKEVDVPTEMTTEEIKEVLKEIEVVQDEEDKRSLWERYRKRRGWGALSVSDFASPSWCEYQHTYRLASKSWLPPLDRPATITTSKGLEITVDQNKTVKREKVLVKGTEVHAKIEKQVMGDVEQVKVDTEGGEAWWALRILNTIVSLSILNERGRVREVPVVGWVRDRLVFGVIDEIERREIAIPPPPSTSSQPSASSSSNGTKRPTQPGAPKSRRGKSTPSKSNSAPSPTKKNDQSTLFQFFSPSPTKPTCLSKSNGTKPAESDKGKGKEKDTTFHSDDALMALTEEDDLADLAALAEVEELERLRMEARIEPSKTRWGYVMSDTKTRFNRSLPPEPETLPAKLQLMLYHRLFTSLLQPEPPPSPSCTSSSPSRAPTPSDVDLVPTGPFLWSKLYSRFSLDPSTTLPASFLSAVEPIIEASHLDELVGLGGATTLNEYVAALVRVGELLYGGTAGEKGGVVLERELEICYVLRDGGWKGRRSAKKSKRGTGSEKEKVGGKTDKDIIERDEAADLEAAIRLSLQDQEPTARPIERKEEPIIEPVMQDPLMLEDDEEDSQRPFLANPSLPLSFELPPPLSQQTDSQKDEELEDPPAAFLLPPANSQAREENQDEPAPAVANGGGRRDRKRYNLRSGLQSVTKSTTRVSETPSPLREKTPLVPPAPLAPPSVATPSSSPPPSSPDAQPFIIGTSRFPLSLPLLSSHLSKSLSYWNGEREPIGVSIENVSRCRTCEFEEGCEWREGKAKELSEKRKRSREVESQERRKRDKSSSKEMEKRA
ncbi:hypothetical protein JCM16303_005313 [Sporobolomyces ruberrimus]